MNEQKNSKQLHSEQEQKQSFSYPSPYQPYSRNTAPYPSYTPPTPRKKAVFDGKDKVCAFLCFLLAFAFFDLILFGALGISVTIFTVIFYAIIFWYFAISGKKMKQLDFILLIPVALTALFFALYDNAALKGLNLIFLYGTITLQLIHMFSYEEDAFGISKIIAWMKLSIIEPFSNLGQATDVIGGTLKGGKRSRLIGQILIGLLISVPILLFVFPLLINANDAFREFVETIVKNFLEKFGEFFIKCLLSCGLIFIVLSFFYALRYKKSEKISFDHKRYASMPATISVTTLIVLIVIYVTYLIVQFADFLSYFDKLTEKSAYYAYYARSGFFELSWVAIINLCVLGFFMFFTKRDTLKISWFFRIISTIMSGLTLLLIASAFYKMLLYVDQYGLTMLRVFTSWFMIFVALIFIYLIVRSFSQKFRLLRYVAVTAFVMYLILNLANTDYLIASYNIQKDINQMKSGTSELDVAMFYSDLSCVAVMPAEKLLSNENTPASLKNKIFYFYRVKQQELDEKDSYKSFNLDAYLAEKVLKRYSAEIDAATDPFPKHSNYYD